MLWRLAPIIGLFVMSGCSYDVAERTDRMIADIARKPFDPEPKNPAKASETPGGPTLANNSPEPSKQIPGVAKDVRTANYLEAQADPKESPFELNLLPGIPGREVPEIKPKSKEELQAEIRRIYKPLEPLPEEPKPLPRADGKPYTLTELQEIAALHSPTLKQAASDVRAAEGTLVKAKTYANPTVAASYQASNDGETAGVWGLLFDQKISTFGKNRLNVAAAQKDYDNAELALRRARSDLATQVRTAYFGLLMAREALRVNRALAVLTDEIYRAQVSQLLRGGLAAGYEPAGLRSQARLARLTLRNSITNYQFAWLQVANTIGLRQLPLSEVAGRIDSHIPYYDYDAVLAKVLANHTDLLTARNGIEKARYQLKSQQVTPLSDVDFQFFVGKETSLLPFQWQAVGQVGITLPLWDRNRGGIMSAQAALIRAVEQPHAAEITIANNLQNAFNNYKNNLDSLKDYRRYILPDQVIYYRGVLERRQKELDAPFNDLVAAQQALSASVTSYLTILNQLWTSAIQVADFLQTDDLFELANPQAVPALPDFGKLMPLPCCHPTGADGGPTAPKNREALPAPTPRNGVQP